MTEYDVAIIGAGPGGYVAAIRCARHGLSTVLIERDEVGGTCLNSGCIPTKTLLKNAELLRELAYADERGILVGDVKVDMPKVLAMKDRVVKQLVGGVGMLLKANGVHIVRGYAQVSSPASLTVNGENIAFKNLIIATGSSDTAPPPQGMESEGVLTSAELLSIDHVPERLAIIGGGVIGCEFASIFSAFGSRVTIVEMMPHLLPQMDGELSAALEHSLAANGIRVLTQAKVSAVTAVGSEYRVAFEGGRQEPLIAGRILAGIGRSPNLDGIGLQDLEMEGGYIKVDEHMQTNIPNVYAVGDVTGKMPLAHAASAQGMVAADTIAGGHAEISDDAVPHCVYTIPEIGTVGLAESQARAQYREIVVGRFPLAANGRALASGAPEGFVKLVADAHTGRLLGCHILGQSATELIGEAAAFLRMRATLKDVASTIHAHPTVSECIQEAARAALGEPVHLFKRRVGERPCT